MELDYFRVELFMGTAAGRSSVARTVEAKGYRSALRQVYQAHKLGFKWDFGSAIWVRVTNIATNKTKNYFVKLGKRGAILKIE